MSEWRQMQAELAAKRVERRSFLKGAAALSTLAMLETSSIAKALVRSYGPADARKIDTIVVTLMENRSTDHFLGWMGSVIDGVQAGFWNPARLDASGGACNSDPTHQFPIADATPVPTYRLPGHCLGSDPDHGWTGSRIEFNGGAMNGFAHRSGADAMGYYVEDDVPFLGWLAKNYTTFSRYFSSVMGPTYPNRLYWLAGQGGGYKGNTIPAPKVNDSIPPAAYTDGEPEPDGHDWSSVFHQLDYHGIPWTYYHHDLATVMLFFNRVEENPGKVRFIGDYYADAAAGILTPIVFLDPGFVTVGNDDHPARDIAFGQRYLYDTFMALAESRHWYSPRTEKGSVYVVSYDEGGGFYDHVPPPRVTDPNGSANHCEDWGRLGFRVPTVVASPFSRGPDAGGPTGVVNQNLFDHTSILKFIQWRFGLGSLNDRAYPGTLGFENGLNLGSRDNAPEIHNLAEVLDFANPRPEFPSEPPQIPLHPEGLWCAQSQFPEETGGENPLEPVPEIPLPPLARPRVPEPVVPHADWVALADRGFFGKYDYRERAKHGVLRD